MKWFAIRVTYGREKKFCKALEDEGFTTFVPPVSNLCFVRSEKADLDSYMISLGENCPARYIWDRATGGPIVVPDKAMDDFIHVTRIMADDALYLNELGPKLREGQKVRVKSGPLAGVEGRVARIKRSRRVVVELPGLLAVATTYVKPSDIEVL
jgi:transcription antitermination factor NusG